MVPSYCDYIRDYVHSKGSSSLPTPGEHHFVSAYLVPKLFAINGKVPDYINPDQPSPSLVMLSTIKTENITSGLK